MWRTPATSDTVNAAVDRLQEALQNRSIVLCLRPQDERAFVPVAKSAFRMR